mgnify:CR=1 FL=1
MIGKGNMTDAEYIAALENEIKKRDKRIDKLEIENECLKTVLSSGGRAFSCDSNGDTAQILVDFTKNS